MVLTLLVVLVVTCLYVDFNESNDHVNRSFESVESVKANLHSAAINLSDSDKKRIARALAYRKLAFCVERCGETCSETRT